VPVSSGGPCLTEFVELRTRINHSCSECLRPLVHRYLEIILAYDSCERVAHPRGRPSSGLDQKHRAERGAVKKSEDTVATSEHVRRRHYLFLETAQAIKRPTIDYRNAWGAKGHVLSNARSYVKKVQNRAIVLRNLETDEIRVIPYFTRFSDGYYRAAIGKLRKLRADRGVFLTLTIDPTRFVSLDHAYREIQAAWNRLLTMLQKRCGHRLEFVKIVEFQKNGSPHLHVLFLNIARLIDADELREFWDHRYGQGTFVYLKKLGNRINKVVSYLVKYMEKNLTMPDIEFQGPDGLTDAASFQQIALSWALNLRAFSTSKGIFNTPPMNNSNSIWEFLGVFDFIDAENWDGKRFSDIEADFVRLKAELELRWAG